MSDAIYGRVPGANYDAKAGYWTVPCDSLVNLTFVFGGQEVFIHPLDVVMSEFAYKDSNGNSACVGAVSVASLSCGIAHLIRSSSNLLHRLSACSENTISYWAWLSSEILILTSTMAICAFISHAEKLVRC